METLETPAYLKETNEQSQMNYRGLYLGLKTYVNLPFKADPEKSFYREYKKRRSKVLW